MSSQDTKSLLREAALTGATLAFCAAMPFVGLHAAAIVTAPPAASNAVAARGARCGGGQAGGSGSAGGSRSTGTGTLPPDCRPTTMDTTRVHGGMQQKCWQRRRNGGIFLRSRRESWSCPNKRKARCLLQQAPGQGP